MFPEILQNLSLLIPLFPFLAMPFIYLTRKKEIFGHDGGGIISVAANALSWIIAVVVFIFGLLEFAAGNYIEEEVILYTFLENPKIQFGILLDPLSIIMAAVVSTLALLIQIYSLGYMKDEPGKKSGRYFTQISLFVGSMLGLSLSLNFLLLFICWELMGFCSYLLIGFFYDKETDVPGTGPASAAKKAFLITKIGDVLLFSGFLLLMLQFIQAHVENPLSFIAGKAALEAAHMDPQLQTLIAILIFGGAVGKSAQFPLHVWLPDAMEGPTTVSALIHSATMVKAGVFLLARVFWVFEGTDALLIVATIGGFTAFFAATMAFVAKDIKRVLAYSTISQLAYMILGIGVGGVASGIFHLMSHSFFKCLLFLGAGSIIHSYHTQDIREVHDLPKYMPITSITFVIGALALGGIFPLNGFFSKDAIFASAWFKYTQDGNFLYLMLFLLAVITAFMTGFYIFRVVFHIVKPASKVSVHAHESSNNHSHSTPHESPNVMTYPLIILATIIVLMGIGSLIAFFTDQLLHIPIPFNPVSEHNLVEWMETLYLHFHPHALELWEILGLMGLSLLVASSGIILAGLIYAKTPLEASEKFLGKLVASLLVLFERIGSPFRSAHAVLYASSIGRGLVYVLEHRYGIDAFYRNLGIALDRTIGEILFRTDKRALDGIVHSVAIGGLLFSRFSDWTDRKVVDGIVNKTGSIFIKLGNLFSKLQTGVTQNYAVGMFLGLLAFIVIWFIGLGFNGGF